MHLSASHAFVSRGALPRLLFHAVVAAGLNTVLLVGLDAAFPIVLASALYTVLAPGVAGLVAWNYARRPNAAEPLLTAIGFTGVAAVVDLVAVSLAAGGAELLHPAFGLGFPLLLTFGATGLVGEIVSTLKHSQRT